MNGRCLDTSALPAYASGISIEPGALIVLAEKDPDQRIWVPARCLGQAQPQLAGRPGPRMLDLLFTASMTATSPCQRRGRLVPGS